MSWLQSIDAAAFRCLNQSLSNAVFDRLMPFLSGNPYFIPALIVGGLLVLWKGGRRARVCLLMLGLVLCTIDPFVCTTLKQLLGRPRPFLTIADAHVLVGRIPSFSLPSGHATNWFGASMVLLIYYRRSFYFMFPLAAAVGYSRVYNGVHYPLDVLGGAILGAGGGAAMVLFVHHLWQFAGAKWFPLWWARLPSLLDPERPAEGLAADGPALARHWLRLGYAGVALLLVVRLGYLNSGNLELSEDEAYQWTWSKHLALSYFSKPPLIAYTQFLGTHLWGDTAFGVRFFSPVTAALLSWLWLRWLARQASARAGFMLVLLATTTPLLAVGSVLMTIDPLSVLFWSAALITGWTAVQRNSSGYWLLTGLWLGLGFLSKYTAVFQGLCWAVFFGLWKPARAQLKRPGPYLALGLALLCALPVLLWNYQHQWITVTHVAADGSLNRAWRPTLRFLADFSLSEAGLLNPIYFGGALWASLAGWRRLKDNPFQLYLFCMGAPLFLFFWLYSLHSRVFPNWIAPSVLPLFALAAVYWEGRWQAGLQQVKGCLAVGAVFGAIAVVLLHDTDLIGKITGYTLPPKLDPLRRVRAWTQTAAAVGQARNRLLAEGKPVFIIGDHYGIVGELSFYLPEAKAGVPNHPLVYYETSETPENQYFFWPAYRERHGQNAIYIQQTDRPKPPPQRVRREFATMKDLGLQQVLYHGRVFRTLQLFECRTLR